MKCKSFWKGFCSIFDIFGTSYKPYIPKQPKSIRKTFQQDMKKISNDFNNVMGWFSKIDRKTLEKISEALYKTDPMGQIRMGAYKDEYDYEAELIADRLDNGELLSISMIYDVFHFSFSGAVGCEEDFKESYQEIKKILNK